MSYTTTQALKFRSVVAGHTDYDTLSEKEKDLFREYYQAEQAAKEVRHARLSHHFEIYGYE